MDVLRKLPSYLAIHSFSDPPQLSDLEGFTLEQQEHQGAEELQDRALRGPTAD
jgi:hypothetical protein